jgi:hypothetical protein
MVEDLERGTGVPRPCDRREGERRLSPAAQRALAEAVARRAEIDARVAQMPREQGARREREPVRYGDWETRGLTSDF